jgi:nucleotide-binding universal stress UspA family protein
MKTFNLRRILVPYDFSKTADLALNKAAFIAKATKATLYLVHINKVNDLYDLFLLELKIVENKSLEKFITDKLQVVANKIKNEFGCTVITKVTNGSIASEIIFMTDEIKADLIIMGTKGKDSTSDLFLGSNAYRVITKTEIPVMTIAKEISKKEFKTILLPIDLSNHSRQKVNYAIGFAKTFQSKIVSLGIYSENEKEDKYKLEIINSQIEKLCKKSNIVFESRIEKTKHRISKTLSVAKRINADLIITMTDQKLEGAKKWLSSYDHELINNSKTPVISIQPELNDEFSGSSTMLPY